METKKKLSRVRQIIILEICCSEIPAVVKRGHSKSKKNKTFDLNMFRVNSLVNCYSLTADDIHGG